MGVARRAQAGGVRCVVIGGSVSVAGREALATVGAEAVAAHDTPITVDEALAAGTAPIEDCAERLARSA
jgi:hypothetical protein